MLLQAVQGIVEGYESRLDAALEAALNTRKLQAASPTPAASAGAALPVKVQVRPGLLLTQVQVSISGAICFVPSMDACTDSCAQFMTAASCLSQCLWSRLSSCLQHQQTQLCPPTSR